MIIKSIKKCLFDKKFKKINFFKKSLWEWLCIKKNIKNFKYNQMDNKFFTKGYKLLIMKKILIVAPHTDDETLGCGGTILKNLDEGNIVCCLIVTKLKEQPLKNRKKLEPKKL